MPGALVRLACFCALATIIGSSLAFSARPVRNSYHSCPVFPKDNHWNQRVDGLPAARGSNAVVARIGADAFLHPHFGSGLYRGAPIGIPFATVGGAQREVPVAFANRTASDPGLYPIPRNAPIQGGSKSTGDRHVLVVDRDECRLYELYAAYPVAGGRSWRAGAGIIWNLRSNRLRKRGLTSADAAGLPIFPGLARYDEVARGRIDHALRVTVPKTRRSFVYPARHFASTLRDRDLPPMGLRLRLKSSVDISTFPPQSRIVLRALKRYGVIVADHGGAWYVTGAPSPGWDNDDLHQLHRIHGRDFEVVDTRSLPRPRE